MYTCYIQTLRILASVTEQAGLNLTWSEISEDTFSRDVTHIRLRIAGSLPIYSTIRAQALKNA